TEDVTFVATQVAALQSRDLAERVIRTWKLSDDPAFLHPSSRSPAPSPDGLRDALRPAAWAGGASVAHTDVQPGPPVDRHLMDRYMRWLSVSDVRGTDLIEVRFTTGSPSLSAFLAAAHTQAFIDANEDSRRTTDAMANEFLEEQLDRTREQAERAQEA